MKMIWIRAVTKQFCQFAQRLLLGWRGAMPVLENAADGLFRVEQLNTFQKTVDIVTLEEDVSFIDTSIKYVIVLAFDDGNFSHRADDITTVWESNSQMRRNAVHCRNDTSCD